MTIRLISSFFALLILFNCVSNLNGQILEDFENGLSDWNTRALNATAGQITTAPNDSANQVWRQGRPTGVSNSNIADGIGSLNHEFTFGPTGNNNARIGVDFYADEGSRSDIYSMQIGIGSYFDSTPDNFTDFAALFYIRFDIQKGYHFAAQNGSVATDIDASWIPERWYNVAFELDTATQTYEVYLDGNKLFYDSDGNGSADSSTFNFNNYSLDLYSVAAVSPWASTQADEFLYIDNITLNANPTPTLLGDVGLDGVVSFSDIPAFITVLQSGGFLREADCNQDGVVNFNDIPAFINILSSL